MQVSRPDTERLLNINTTSQSWYILQADSRTDFRDLAIYHYSAMAKALKNVPDIWQQSFIDDESTCVALLDMHVAHGLQLWFTIKKNPNSEQTLIRPADAFAENIRSRYPLAMRSRPYLRWILLKSAILGSKSMNGLTDPHSAIEERCRNFPGLVIHLRSDFTSFYIPRDTENPGWCLPEAPAQTNAPLHTVVKASEQLHDLATQALAHRLIIWRSGSPFPLIQQLSLWQNEKQGDARGRLETLLSSYLACDDRASRDWLLAQLKDTNDWTGGSQLRDPLLYFARDFMQREIERGLHGTQALATLRTEDCRYYRWLHNQSQRFIEEDQIQNGDRRQPSTTSEAAVPRRGQEFLTEKDRQEEEAPPREERRREGIREVKVDISRQNDKIKSRPSLGESPRKGDREQSSPAENGSSRTIYVPYCPDSLDSSSYFSDSSNSSDSDFSDMDFRRPSHGKHFRIFRDTGSTFETDTGSTHFRPNED